MREENFWCKKPRYSEVRVIARRVIARYDCIDLSNLSIHSEKKKKEKKEKKEGEILICNTFSVMRILIAN